MSHVNLVSSCCEEPVETIDGFSVCTVCNEKCDAITPYYETAEGRAEAAAERLMDADREESE